MGVRVVKRKALIGCVVPGGVLLPESTTGTSQRKMKMMSFMLPHPLPPSDTAHPNLHGAFWRVYTMHASSHSAQEEVDL